MHVKLLKWLRITWPGSTICSIFYFAAAYILPSAGMLPPLAIPMKVVIEGLLLMLPPITGVIVIGLRIASHKVSMSIKNGLFLVQLDQSIAATCVLQLNSVSGSVNIDDNGECSYAVAALLALREGMDDDTVIAYEVGTINQEPFIRLFITALGDSLASLRQLLQIEATRSEAILRSALKTVEMKRLRHDELRQAIITMRNTELGIEEQKPKNVGKEYQKTIAIIGDPSINVNREATQIGTFLAGLLREGYDASLTCAFRPTNSGKEKGVLERRWKNIRRKEREKRESLSDQAMKRKLLEEYQEISNVDAWFEASIYVTIRAGSESNLELVEQGVSGLVISIWGQKGTLALESVKLGNRNRYRVLGRRGVRNQRLHLERLVAFFNTPSQQLPVVTGKSSPQFPIPERRIIDNELVIGKAVFNSSCLGEVGLKTNWLREHVAVMGATGTGKTTFVKRLITELSGKTEVPWLIFDIKGSEYADLKDAGIGSVKVLVPGVEDDFVLNLFAAEGDDPERHAHITFTIIRELLNERDVSAELSPAMEKLLRETVKEVVLEGQEKTAGSLEQAIERRSGNARISDMTRDALLNRLQVLFREPLATVFGPGEQTLEISALLDERVIVDLSYVARIGGMEAARLLYNVIVKRVFDSAMKRGIIEGLHHVVVLEEAYNLVPESYTRSSAADVTTGESMVMLQRATGQGVVVVSTRPNISSNILANTSTKITFRLPYDSAVGRRYLSLDDRQEEYLQSLGVGNALIKLPDLDVFEIKTLLPEYEEQESSSSSYQARVEEKLEGNIREYVIDTPSYDGREEAQEQEKEIVTRKQHILGEISGLVTGYLASRDFVTREQLECFLGNFDYKEIDMTREELIEELISLSIIQREALPVVSGGFVFSVAGNANASIRAAISQYILEKAEMIQRFDDDGSEGSPDFIVGNNAILIIPERIRMQSIENTIGTIRNCMMKVGTAIEELYVIVRGSIAAAKVRERIENSDGFDLVTIVPAFQSSIDRMVGACTESQMSSKDTTNRRTHEITSALEELNGDVEKSTGRVGKRIWFGLLHEFLSVSGGAIRWNELLSFINTTAIQSKKARSVPLSKEGGLQAILDMIDKGQCHLFRGDQESGLCDLGPGLWVLGRKQFENIRYGALDLVRKKLDSVGGDISVNHYPFDFCLGGKSYAVLPERDRVESIINSDSIVICDSCQSRKAICILGDSRLVSEDTVIPSNVVIRYWEEGMASILSEVVHG